DVDHALLFGHTPQIAVGTVVDDGLLEITVDRQHLLDAEAPAETGLGAGGAAGRLIEHVLWRQAEALLHLWRRLDHGATVFAQPAYQALADRADQARAEKEIRDAHIDQPRDRTG